jgi:tRNA threonylcarbamoyladenosine biosynthesis protein TsaB
MESLTKRETTVLGFDTATAAVAVAVTRGGETIAERFAAAEPGARPRHAAQLLGEVERVADEAGGWERIERIGVGLGPGSFTGLRVGIATARALAQGLPRPVVGVGSLDALAAGIGELSAAAGRPRLAIIDARRSQVFAALRDGDGEQVWGPLVLSPGELGRKVSSLARTPLAAGDGAVRFRRDLEGAGADVLPDGDAAHRLSARQVCLLAGAAAGSAPREIKPIYLRPPDAEIWRERDRGDGKGD